MDRHNEDIAACTNDRCKKRLECLRWQLGTNKDPYQTYLVESGTEGCEFQIAVN